MLKISKENLNGLYRKLSAAMPLYMPLKKAGEVNYGLWTISIDLPSVLNFIMVSLCGKNRSLGDFTVLSVSTELSAPSVQRP